MAAGVLLWAWASGPAAAGLSSPGCLSGGEPARISDIDEALDLHFSDGRVVRLSGVAVDPGRGAEARASMRAWLLRTPPLVHALRGEPDRWGRIPALVFAGAGGESSGMVSVSEALLDAGLVLARPDADVDPCWTAYLALEAEARRAGRGIWAARRPIVPGDAAALRDGVGALAIVRGRLARVHAGRARLYLRFADDGGTGFAAALALPLSRRMAKAGQDPAGWVGRDVTVRGLLDDRWGWQIDVTSTQQLQLDPP